MYRRRGRRVKSHRRDQPLYRLSCAAALVLFAFVPKYAALFLMLAQPVIGAAMVFTSSFMISGGIQIIVSRNLDSRATYVVGVSMLLGLAREIFPRYFSQVAPAVHLFTASMMSIGVMSAFVLNLVFRLGATRSVVFRLEQADSSVVDIENALRARGKAWFVPAWSSGRSPRPLRSRSTWAPPA